MYNIYTYLYKSAKEIYPTKRKKIVLHSRFEKQSSTDAQTAKATIQLHEGNRIGGGWLRALIREFPPVPRTTLPGPLVLALTNYRPFDEL